ncbi:TIGR00730 family Rossman fold protein [Verrucomicrobiota bacterium]
MTADKKNELEQNVKKIMKSSSYLKAYEDIGFFKRDELRAVRLQLELLKPELIQQDHNIASTIVVFGSARTQAPETAGKRLKQLKKQAEQNPGDEKIKDELKQAKRDMENSCHYEQAREFSRIVSSTCQIDKRCEYVMVTGGGPGIMEAVNRGAHDVGAKSLGLNISLPHEQNPNPYITPELCFNFQYFAIRKMHFLMRAKAIVVFPGGFGTIDELFETLTLIQTGKADPVPIVLFNKKFWDRIVNFDVFVEEGMISPEDLQLFQYAETVQDAWGIITRFHEAHEGRDLSAIYHGDIDGKR